MQIPLEPEEVRRGQRPHVFTWSEGLVTLVTLVFLSLLLLPEHEFGNSVENSVLRYRQIVDKDIYARHAKILIKYIHTGLCCITSDPRSDKITTKKVV